MQTVFLCKHRLLCRIWKERVRKHEKTSEVKAVQQLEKRSLTELQKLRSPPPDPLVFYSFRRGAGLGVLNMLSGRFSLLLLVLVLVWSTEGLKGLKVMKVRRKAWKTRPCADLPEELLEQMFGGQSVGILNAFSHTLQLVPGPQNLSCPSAARPNGASHAPVNLLSLSPWAYRYRAHMDHTLYVQTYLDTPWNSV